ncbi:hypothetical protein [Candidatus Pelagibacter communis]|uniref:hypothetical protein n=1 Tax=Pelagibacter ubique TaxID=198252 RepID=UPI00065B366A|nr:hypothetical protein [Candidatus Pelagibacter ubique]
MKLLKSLFVIIFFISTNSYAEIYKLNCKYSEELGGGNKSVKTSVWYINNEKKMIALAKINNSNVKYTSNKWDSKSFGVKNDEVFINRSQMKIKNNIYEVGASTNKDTKEIILMALSEEGLDKDPTWIKLQKDTKKLLAKKNTPELEKQVEKIYKLNDQVVAKWTIEQKCSKPSKVKTAKKDPLNKVKDKLKETLDKIN